LGVDYIDLYLMHWPCSTDPADTNLHTAFADWDFIDTWREMEKLVGTGRVRNIGVSNFDVTQLNRLLRTAKVIPAVNQIELHPNNPTPKVTKFCADRGIHCTAYSVLGSTNSPLAKDQTLAGIASKHGRSTQQVLLAWALHHGYSVIPKSVTESRIVGNFQVDGLVLEDEDLKSLDSLPDRFKVCGDAWLPHKIFLDRPE
jgi:glycerol 2-dehydrogenase (NADP+)